MCVCIYVSVGVYVQIHMYIFEEWFFLLSLSLSFLFFSVHLILAYLLFPWKWLFRHLSLLVPSPELESMLEHSTKKKKKKKKKKNRRLEGDVHHFLFYESTETNHCPLVFTFAIHPPYLLQKNCHSMLQIQVETLKYKLTLIW